VETTSENGAKDQKKGTFTYCESPPGRLPETVFRIYQYLLLEPEHTSGIVLDDACPEFMFLHGSSARFSIRGGRSVEVPFCFAPGKFDRPFRFVHDGQIRFFSIKLHPWVAGHFFPGEKRTTLTI